MSAASPASPSATASANTAASQEKSILASPVSYLRSHPGVESYTQIVTLLESHRDAASQREAYDDADKIHKQLAALSIAHESQIAHKVQQQHALLSAQLSDDFAQQQTNFDTDWTQLLNAHDDETRQMLRDLQANQKSQLDSWFEAKQNKLLTRPMFSRAYVTMRSEQQAAAASHIYKQAAALKANADELQQKELNALRQKCESDLALHKAQTATKHAQEIDHLIQRRARHRQELLAQKEVLQQQQLKQRHENLQNSLAAEAERNIKRLQTSGSQAVLYSAKGSYQSSSPKSHSPSSRKAAAALSPKAKAARSPLAAHSPPPAK